MTEKFIILHYNRSFIKYLHDARFMSVIDPSSYEELNPHKLDPPTLGEKISSTHPPSQKFHIRGNIWSVFR